jgi:hypothetical protein
MRNQPTYLLSTTPATQPDTANKICVTSASPVEYHRLLSEATPGTYTLLL